MAEVLNAGYVDEMTPVVPQSPEVEAMGATHDGSSVAQLAIEEIMKTDPSAAFEWPTGMSAATGGVTYTPPTGDE